MEQTIRIGNAQAFWGDSPTAPARLVEQAPDLDCLTLDYLAEVSMSILARQRERDPSAGYARDFLPVIESLAPAWRAGRQLHLVTNAGGLNAAGCAEQCRKLLTASGSSTVTVAVVEGDDVLEDMRSAIARDPATKDFSHLETGEPISTIADRIVTANAYLGAGSIAEAIKAGADVVITGRIADPSLTVGPCIAHFDWDPAEWGCIAGATVAGHLIECGTQVTGGISTDWLDIPHPADIGFPIVEVAADGSCIVTKPAGTGGRVCEQTVKEQLLYEIGDPSRYLSPDATVSFLELRVNDEGTDRVRVRRATGTPPPATLKVSATYRAGFRATGTLVVTGRNAAEKAHRCGQIVLNRLTADGAKPARFSAEVIGDGAVFHGSAARDDRRPGEVLLRISAADDNRETVERFTREIVPLVTSGPQGTTGYFEGRPSVREVFGYWPTLISRGRVRPTSRIIGMRDRA